MKISEFYNHDPLLRRKSHLILWLVVCLVLATCLFVVNELIQLKDLQSLAAATARQKDQQQAIITKTAEGSAAIPPDASKLLPQLLAQLQAYVKEGGGEITFCRQLPTPVTGDLLGYAQLELSIDRINDPVAFVTGLELLLGGQGYIQHLEWQPGPTKGRAALLLNIYDYNEEGENRADSGN